jgi:hypothetical protein
LNVRCINHNNNAASGGMCGWIGKCEELENHFLKGCFVNCSACKIDVLRKDYIHHIDVACKTICKYCGLDIIFKMLNDHEDFDCLEKPIKCSNAACHLINIARKDLQNHKQNDCLFQPVKCPFFVSGCGKNCRGLILRKNFEAHITDNTNTSSAFISSSKKTVELENKFLVLSASPQSKVFVIKLLNLAKEMHPIEEVLLKKWIELYNNNNSNNKQPIEIFFKDIVVEKKRKLNNEEKLQISNTIIFEFKIPKNFTKNDDFLDYSHTKDFHEEIKGYVYCKYFKDSEFFGLYFCLENFNKNVTFQLTLLNFNDTKNKSRFSLTINWKEMKRGEGYGNRKFIKFDDFINENFLFEENYVASIIAKIDLEI